MFPIYLSEEPAIIFAEVNDHAEFLNDPAIIRWLGAQASRMVIVRAGEANIANPEYTGLITTRFEQGLWDGKSGITFEAVFDVDGVQFASATFLLVNQLTPEEVAAELTGTEGQPAQEEVKVWN